MKQTLYTLISLLMLFLPIAYTEEIRIEITQGIDLARPIGIVPFKWNVQNVDPIDIGDILMSDLRNSGKFNPLNSFYFPQRPSTAQEVRPTTWSELGIESVVVGQITSNLDKSYNITYQLVDTSNNSPGTILAQNSYKVNKQWLRYAAHTISDVIFEKLSGTKGVFRTRIAYVIRITNNKGGDNQFLYELHVSDYDGYNQFVVRRSSQPLMSPAWSPDGHSLAYVTFENGHSVLVIQTLSNGVIRQIASFPRHNGAPTFSPDGTKLAFALSKTGSLNLYVMDFSSGHIRQVTCNRNNNTEPSWFPDNQNLAFTSDQTNRTQIYKININNGISQRITWGNSQNQNADVSSDGKFMVMVNLDKEGQQHIAKQDLVTGNMKILTSTFLDETPSLSPNGTMLVYSSSLGEMSMLNLISTDGRFKTCILTTSDQIKFPTWSPYL